MAGYIGSSASVSTSGVERKKTFAVTTTTTSLTGVSYTRGFVHVYHNGIRLVDGTDYTATNGTSITLVNAAESGDEVVVVSYATFSPADTYSKAEADAEFLNDPASVITVSGSNVGIGTASPTSVLSVSDNVDTNAASGTGVVRIQGALSTYSCYIGMDAQTVSIGTPTSSRGLSFVAGGSESARFDSSGNLLVGKTSSDTGATEGIEFNRSIGTTYLARDAGPPAVFNRNIDNGDIAIFRQSGSNVGSIGSRSAGSTSALIITFDSGSNGVGLSGTSSSSNAILPSENGGLADNVVDLGHISYRFDDIYATNGTIQTSDRNEKQDIEVLTAAETAVAVACKGLLRKFRWIDSVTEKGDDARIHFGIIAQDLQDAFTAEGLDAGRYAMFISTTWWETQTDVPAVVAVDEVLDEDGNVVTGAVEAKDAYTRTDTFDTLAEAPEGATERTRLGVRYPELLAFIIGAM